LRLIDSLPNLDFSLDLEIFESLRPPLSFPKTEMTASHGAFCFATGEVTVDAAFTYSVVAFCVDLEAKAGMCSGVTSTDRTLVWGCILRFSMEVVFDGDPDSATYGSTHHLPSLIEI
jgi:hypothetical protein